MCGIVVSLPVYDTCESELFDPDALAALLPDVTATDPLRDGLPDPALLGDWEKALAYAADQFRSPDVVRLVGDPVVDTSPIRIKVERLNDWIGRLDRALDAQPHGLDTGA